MGQKKTIGELKMLSNLLEKLDEGARIQYNNLRNVHGEKVANRYLAVVTSPPVERKRLGTGPKNPEVRLQDVVDFLENVLAPGLTIKQVADQMGKSDSIESVRTHVARAWERKLVFKVKNSGRAYFYGKKP